MLFFTPFYSFFSSFVQTSFRPQQLPFSPFHVILPFLFSLFVLSHSTLFPPLLCHSVLFPHSSSLSILFPPFSFFFCPLSPSPSSFLHPILSSFSFYLSSSSFSFNNFPSSLHPIPSFSSESVHPPSSPVPFYPRSSFFLRSTFSLFLSFHSSKVPPQFPFTLYSILLLYLHLSSDFSSSLCFHSFHPKFLVHAL